MPFASGRNHEDVSDELSLGEETFAADGPGNDIDNAAEEMNLGIMEGLTVNQRFEEQPRSYFEEKVRIRRHFFTRGDVES